ncbi:MAG: flagellar export chaperone FlgN [Alishewanella aestuarii]
MNSSHDLIITVLTKQAAQLDALLLLLKNELSALAERQVETLEQVIAEKTVLLTQISATDAELAAQPQLAAVKAEAWFVEQRALLEQKLADCKAQTAVNQQALEQSQLILQRFKNELLGAKGKSGLTYTSKGQPAVENKGPGIKA